MKKLVIALLFLGTTVTMAQEKVLLRLNYQKGAKYAIEMKQNVNSSAMMMNSTMGMQMEVTDKKDDVFTSETKITKMVMDMMQGGMQISYDSTKKEEELDQMGKMMKAQVDPMMKVVITTKIDQLGQTKDVQVAPASTPNADQFKNQSNIQYPKHAVKVGDTWTNETEAQGMKTKMVYKVVKITKAEVTLSATGTISGLGTGSSKGDFVLDRKTGLAKKSSVKSEIKTGGQDMKVSINLTMKKI